MTKFDKEYYERLADGLEVSEVSYEYVKKASDIFRFDSFYYAKEFLNEEHLIEKRNSFLLRDLAVSLKSFGAYEGQRSATCFSVSDGNVSDTCFFGKI